MKFYDNGIPYQIYGKRGIRGMAGPDGNPIGTIIDYIGKSAPDDYLVCNGKIHKISDYPDLSDFFEAQYGKKNEFGGDGTSTFGVPAFSGEQGVLKCIKATKEEPYEDIYSEKETVIGRWIDGKPIYRRLLYGTSGSKAYADAEFENDISDLADVLCVYGIMFRENNNFLPIPSQSVALSLSNEKGFVYVTESINLNKNFRLIVEYTKTIDEPLT